MTDTRQPPIPMETLLCNQVEVMYLQIKQLERLLREARPYALKDRGDLYDRIGKSLQLRR